jgi:hypothetical protein
MTEPKWKDLSDAERQAIVARCRKLAAASPEPVETPTGAARDWTPEQREAWMAQHRRKFR